MNNEDQIINDIPVATDVVGAKILGINNAGDTRLFSIDNIFGSYKGVVAPTDAPTNPLAGQYWIALTAGTYTNFGGVVLNPSNFGVISYNGTTYSIAQSALTFDTSNFVTNARELLSAFEVNGAGFTFDATTGNLSCANLITLNTKRGNKIFLEGGPGSSGSFRITNYPTHTGAVGDVYALFVDFAVPGTKTATVTAILQTANINAMPDPTAGYVRLIFGIAKRGATASYDISLTPFQFFSETGASKKPFQIISEIATNNASTLSTLPGTLKREYSASDGYVIGNRAYTYDRTTGIISFTNLLTFYNGNGVRYFVTEPNGAASFRVTNFPVGNSADAVGAVRQIFADISIPVSGSILTLQALPPNSMPDVASGKMRINFGYSNKISSTSYDLLMPMLDVYQESAPFAGTLQNLSKVKGETNSSNGFVAGNRTAYTYDVTTGTLSNSALWTYYNANGIRYFVTDPNGAAAFRITNFVMGVAGDAIGSIRIIFADIPIPVSGSILTLQSVKTGSLPAVASGYERIVFGYIEKTDTNVYEANLPLLDIFTQRGTNRTQVQIANSNQRKAQRAFYNLYPHALSKTPLFKAKILAQQDVDILLLGDSLFALQSNTTTVTAPATGLPNGCRKNHVQYQLWNYIAKNKPTYIRWDGTPAYTYTGTWAAVITGGGGSKFDTPLWAGEFRTEVADIYQCNDANAAVSLAWDLSAFEKLNWLYKKSTDATNLVTLTVAEGNGKVQLNNGTTWVEANGYTFSQKNANVAQGEGHALYTSDNKIKMRRVATTGTVNISFAKTSGTDYLYFWGTERWNGPAVFITNVARGGRYTSLLQSQFMNDVVERKPDLVIFELPMTNEYSNYARIGYQTILNNIQDFIWGDRAGATNTLNLKTQSNNWTNFEVLLLMPHYRADYFSGDAPVRYALQADQTTVTFDADSTPYSTNQRVKAMILSHADLNYIDIGDAFIAEAKNIGWTIQQATTGSLSTSGDISFTFDNVHQNDFGSYIWAKILGGVLGNI